MVSIEVIGSLGADASIQSYQGRKFVSFNVADNYGKGESRVTMWYSCSYNFPDAAVVQWLRKGQQVFVRGVPSFRIYDSAALHCKAVGVNVFVTEIQLVGGKPASDSASETVVENKEADAAPF